MLSTYDGRAAFGAALLDGDRAGLPLLGFVLGTSISAAAWGLVGSLVWLLLS